MTLGLMRIALVVLGLSSPRADDPPVKLDPIPTGLPPAVETQMTSRREELRALGRTMNDAMSSWDARCIGLKPTDSGYTGCLDEKQRLQCGFAEMNDQRREFNLQLEAAARVAGVATSLTLTNVSIQGEVNFPAPEGSDLSGGEIAAVRIPVGTRIVTGPTGRFRASIPGGQPFEVGGGAELTLDNTFLNPRATDKVDVNLTHGFFRWLREAVKTLKDDRYRVRRQGGICAVRG